MAKRSPRKAAVLAGPTLGRCELCGQRRLLLPTECCGRLVCGVAGPTIGGCCRRHERYTLCAYHFAEGHEGEWQGCGECRADFKTEMYVWYGTNEHNFVKLENPPSFEPTLCAGCGKQIRLGKDAHQASPNGSYRCSKCWGD